MVPLRFKNEPQRSKKRIFLLHNIISPYRLPLFEGISKIFDVDVFFCMTKSEDRLWQTSTIQNYKFSYRVLPHVMLGPLVLNYSLLLELLKNKYDVYLVGENPENAISVLMTLIFAKLSRKPFILWSGVIEPDSYAGKKDMLKEKVKKAYLRYLYSHTDSFIAYSIMARNFLIDLGALPKKIVIGGQIMPKELIFEPDIDKQQTKYRDKKVVLYVGYLRKGKNVDLLIRAFKRLDLENIVLVIAGSGEEEASLKLIARSDERIIFTGYLEGKEKSNIYSIADVFVLPTLHDSWGLVINEAMYFGLPVITTSSAAGSQLISDNGIIIPPQDETALYDALQKLLSDDILRNEMGHKSKEYIKNINVAAGVETFKFGVLQCLDTR